MTWGSLYQTYLKGERKYTNGIQKRGQVKSKDQVKGGKKKILERNKEKETVMKKVKRNILGRQRERELIKFLFVLE